MADAHAHEYTTNGDRYRCPVVGCWWTATGLQALTPSADLPACRDEAAHPDPPEYQHPEEPEDG